MAGKQERKRSLGRRIREIRKELHLTQEKLAERLNIEWKQLSRYETGEAEPGALVFADLLRLYTAEVEKERKALEQQIRGLETADRELVAGLVRRLSDSGREARRKEGLE